MPWEFEEMHVQLSISRMDSSDDANWKVQCDQQEGIASQISNHDPDYAIIHKNHGRTHEIKIRRERSHVIGVHSDARLILTARCSPKFTATTHQKNQKKSQSMLQK